MNKSFPMCFIDFQEASYWTWGFSHIFVISKFPVAGWPIAGWHRGFNWPKNWGGFMSDLVKWFIAFCGWWFQTYNQLISTNSEPFWTIINHHSPSWKLVGGFKHDWIIFHFIYGMSSFPLTNSIIFQRGLTVSSNHQPALVSSAPELVNPSH